VTLAVLANSSVVGHTASIWGLSLAISHNSISWKCVHPVLLNGRWKLILSPFSGSGGLVVYLPAGLNVCDCFS
jgi:hypothetical protein